MADPTPQPPGVPPSAVDLRAPEEAAEQAWQEWLVVRNRRAARLALWLDAMLYPAFGVLDYLVAPHEWLPFLWTIRAVVLLATLGVMTILDRPVFARHWPLLTGAHVVLSAVGVSAMVSVLGGFASPYYAGLNLVMIGAGLLYVWPRRTVLTTHGTIAASYVLPSLFLGIGPADLLVAISNSFFLSATAVIVVAGQLLVYRAQREQLVTRLTLERTKSHLQGAHDELKRLDEFKSQVFANITHELKTPLAMILAPVELALGGDMGAFSEEQRATLRSIFRNGLRLLRMVNDILELSRLQDARLRLTIAEYDLIGYLRGLLAQVQPLAQRKAIEVTFAPHAGECSVWCDLERVERVLVNLLSNAAKFTPQGGHVAVETHDDGPDLVIEVRDDGPGFPPEQAKRLFERFYQVDMGTARRHGGTGIGLSLARELVELHGGTIQAASDGVHGAVFTVRLPKDGPNAHPRGRDLRDTQELARTGEHTAVDPVVGLAARDQLRFLDISEATERRIVERDPDENRRSHTVLVVDDTPEIIRIVHMALRQEFRVMAAPDGAKGLALALRERPNLVITDLMMPGMDGLELTRELRADPRTRNTPIVMLTARGALDDRLVGLETGANAYLAKPFSPRELLTTVRALLNVQERTAELVLAQRMDSLETVASGLAHEINNPLNYIKNAIEMARRDVSEIVRLHAEAAPDTPPDPERIAKLRARVVKMFETAESGVRRITQTVTLIRRYSREGYDRAPRPYDVFAAAGEVAAVVLPATGRDVQLATHFEGDGTVECVPEEMNQVLTNLVQNAIEAAPDGAGRVELTGTREGALVILTVRDNGPGIEPAVRERLFTPFFTTKGPGRGMGLGLTIAWRVVNSLGGIISATNDAEGGARFIVKVPARRPGAAVVLPTRAAVTRDGSPAA